MTTATPSANTQAAPALDLKDYFASVKDGTRKSSVTEKGELASRIGKKSNDGMDKDAFMTMLVTQLKHQDPLAPQDNQQLSAQMAQFSSLEVMQNVQKGVDGMGSSIAEMTKTQSAAANSNSGASASNLIGKAVSIRQAEVSLNGRDEVALPLQGTATSTLLFKDPAGKVVSRVPLSGSKADGTSILDAKGQGILNVRPVDEAGEPLQGTFAISVEDSQGNRTGDVYQKGTVEGVSYRDGIPYLAVGKGNFRMSDLLTVMPSGETKESMATGAAATPDAGSLSGLSSAAAFLGRTVSVRNPEVALAGGKPATIRIVGTPGSVLELTDAKGAVVKSLPLSGFNPDGTPRLPSSGTGSVSIDPFDDQGGPLNGRYQARIVDGQGRSAGTVFQQGRVDGMEFHEGTPFLSVSGNNYKLSEVLALSAEPTNQGATP